MHEPYFNSVSSLKNSLSEAIDFEINGYSDWESENELMVLNQNNLFKDQSDSSSFFLNEIISISNLLIKSDIRKSDETINYSLNKIGIIYGFERIHIHHYDIHKKTNSISHEWRRNNKIKSIKSKSENDFIAISEMVNYHFDGKNFILSNVNLLPEGIIKELLLKSKTKSCITIPMMQQNHCVGFISYDSVVHKMHFDKNIQNNLALFNNLMSNYLLKINNEKKLSILLETLAKQNGRLKEFSFINSHIIRSSGANLLALSDLINNDPKEEYFNLLKQSINTLNEKIHDVNSILNIDNNIEEDAIEKIDLFESLIKVLKWNENNIHSNEIEIVNHVPKKFFISGIKTYVENILNEILKNAIQFGCSSSKKTIQLELEKFRKTVVLSIKDFGIGMNVIKLGDAIYQIGTRFEGANCNNHGLGLYIAKYQIEAMNGRIYIWSKPNMGTTVELLFNK